GTGPDLRHVRAAAARGSAAHRRPGGGQVRGHHRIPGGHGRDGHTPAHVRRRPGGGRAGRGHRTDPGPEARTTVSEGPEALPGGRTHMCGGLRLEDAGRLVALAGWVGRKRDHGGVIFIDLRDREGVVQVVAHPVDAPTAFEVAEDIKPESVVRVVGEVRSRPEGTANPSLPTGQVEVAASEIKVLSAALTPPFPIEDW